MKKILVLLLVVVILALSALPTLAVPPADLNVLARYFPADTPIFASTRTDDEFVESLDAVLAKIGAAIPDALPPMTIAEGLDQVVGQLYEDGTFAENIRPWLGDTASVAVTSLGANLNDNEAPVIFALSIKDQAATSAFLDDMLTKGNVDFTRVEKDDYLLLLDADDSDQEMVMQSAILLRDDVLMVTNDASSLPTDGLPESPLSADADFTSALDSLPEDSYNLTAYIAFTDIFQTVMASQPEAMDALGAFGSIFDAIGPQVWGFTILDGISPTIDIVQKLGDLSALGDAGLVMGTPKPINLDFAVHVPANAPLAIFASDLKTSIGGALDNLVNMSEMIAGMPNTTGMSPEELQQSIEQFEQAFTAITGLDFRSDVLDWMSGDYALFLMLNPALDTSSMMGLMSAFPVDFGLAIEATDPAAAQNMVEGLTRGLNQTLAMAGLSGDATEEPGNPQPKVDVTSEDLTGTAVTVITITAPDVPWPIELLMGANDEVFALGTRSAVTAILNPDGGLPSNPEFARAQASMLDNPISLAWLGTEGLLPLADLAAAFGQSGSSGDDMTEQIRNAINLFSSGSITSVMTESGSAARLVLTFSE
jgi:Protein of unknown function (DUF3352)